MKPVLGRFLDYKVHPEASGEPARLDGYALRFNKRSKDGSGKANIEPRDGGTVWGVFYVISAADLTVLDKGEGGYARIRRRVVRHSGPIEAWVAVRSAHALKPRSSVMLHPPRGFALHNQQ